MKRRGVAKGWVCKPFYTLVLPLLHHQESAQIIVRLPYGDRAENGRGLSNCQVPPGLGPLHCDVLLLLYGQWPLFLHRSTVIFRAFDLEPEFPHMLEIMNKPFGYCKLETMFSGCSGACLAEPQHD